MSAEEIRRLAEQVRFRLSPVDDELVTRVEGEIDGYRTTMGEPQPILPPAELAETLPVLGWLISEAALSYLWSVASGFETLPGDEGEESRQAARLIGRLADAARRMPWPEFAPRALGALRAQALVESKRDTEAGYDAAYIYHAEARDRLKHYRDSHGEDPARGRYALALDETLLQLVLAETGTACRTAERVVGLWAEEWVDGDSAAWTGRMFRQLSDGATIGEHALATAERIEREHQFTFKVTEDRLAIPTSYRNPAIMTCRALLLVYSMSPEMQALGHAPKDADTWDAFREQVIGRVDRAFGYLRRPVVRQDGSPWPLLADHRRSMVQICLHLALLVPGHELAAELVVDETLTLRRLDDDAAEAMSAWLATTIDGRQRGDANIIGSASKPDFIAAVEACRADAGAAPYYREWRRRWTRLDRYAGIEGRRERLAAILGDGRA
ncbi:hypothetical protein OHA72_35275 [Dactylosporangium sp. NBC_01737]|uniref:hypothetical protein n=1 Tax=Dactylosporangium sp. NBC_01737 TaxID=2975959 RepID=UPI002E146CF1|nr:hypothetical protein OHA72_35275 [Dactylosporangium sp. NBC_01737]